MKDQSRSLISNKILSGFNLSDILNDQSGNIWLASLQKGLFVKYEIEPFKILRDSRIAKDDFVRCVFNWVIIIFTLRLYRRLFTLKPFTLIQSSR